MKHFFYLPLILSLSLSAGAQTSDSIATTDSTNVTRRIDLQEVTVQASRNKKTDRIRYYPNETIRKNSMDGYDVLQRINLPDVIFNNANRTLTLLKNGSLQIRINGVVASQQDLMSVQPSDILRVDYIHSPSAIYGSDVAVVILIKTRRFVGMQRGLSLSQSCNANIGNGMGYVRYTSARNLFGLKINERHHYGSGIYTQGEKIFRYPTKELTQTLTERPYAHKNLNGEVQFEYNRLLDKRESFFNAIIQYGQEYNPRNTIITDVTKEHKPFYTDSLSKRNRVHHFSVDCYWDKNFTNKGNLIANLTGTYINTDYSSSYSKIYAHEYDTNYSHYYNAMGWHASLLGEVIYTRPIFSTYQITLGSKNHYSITHNQYQTSGSISPSRMNKFNSYNYAEISGQLQRLRFTVGGGLSVYNIRNDAHLHKHVFFRPSVQLSCPINDYFNLNYYWGINSTEPQLSQLSDVRQKISENEATLGNPHISPYQAHINQLQLSLRYKKYYCRLTGYYQYNHKAFFSNPVMYDAAENLFIYTQDNQRDFRHLQLKTFAGCRLANNTLNLSCFGVMNRHISHGKEYTTALTTFLGGISAMYDIGNWGLQAGYTSPIHFLTGETLSVTSRSIRLSAHYQIGHTRISINVINPFMKEAGRKQEFDSRLLTALNQTYYNYNNNQISLSFTYTFSQGKTGKTNRQLDNRDNDSGILK